MARPVLSITHCTQQVLDRVPFARSTRGTDRPQEACSLPLVLGSQAESRGDLLPQEPSRPRDTGRKTSPPNRKPSPFPGLRRTKPPPPPGLCEDFSCGQTVCHQHPGSCKGEMCRKKQQISHYKNSPNTGDSLSEEQKQVEIKDSSSGSGGQGCSQARRKLPHGKTERRMRDGVWTEARPPTTEGRREQGRLQGTSRGTPLKRPVP